MKNKILVEGKFGHGGRRDIVSRVRRKLNRLTRPKIGKAGIPFDWSHGIRRSQQLQVHIKDQGTSDSCGGQAKSYWLGIVRALLTQTPYIEQSAKSIYSRIAYPSGGTTIPALAMDYGALDEVDLPSYPNNELDLIKRDWLTTANVAKAMQKSGWTMKSVNLDMESIAEAIRDYGAVLFEVTGQNNGTWLSANPKPPSTDNPNPLWNHFLCGEGASLYNNTQSFSVFESWGTNIGENGIQYFIQDYLDSGYILDCFTFVPNPPKFIFNEDLSYGMKNSDVVQLQKRLGVWQTGYFGILTWTAVVLYQKTHRLPGTGFVGPLTRQVLNSN